MTTANPLAYLSEQLEAWRKAGSYQRLHVLESPCEPISRFDGREVINLASNNYLGLADHPKLIEAQVNAARKYGAGSGAVRTISGTMSIHMQLEERIADFKKTEACVVFQSGFAANAGTVSAILGPEDHIVSDALNHASIIDGCRLSKAKIHVFPHKDTARAAEILKELDGATGHKLLITDGVFSMDGDIGPLPALVEIAERHGAIMMIDDAHSSGVLGRNGRGTVDHFGLHGRVDVQVGTFSKAIGVLGGYVCGSRDLIEFLYHRARPFLFLDVSSAGSRRGMSRCIRHFGERAGTNREAVGKHAVFQVQLEERRVRYRRKRNSHHADHRRRGKNRARVFGRTL